MARSPRNAMLAKLHALKREMGLNEDTYRDRLFLVAGVRSAKDLSDVALESALGAFHVKQSTAHPHLAKPKAIWISCANLGAVDDASDAGLDAFVKRQTGKERLSFLTPVEANSVTEALKEIAARKGFVVPPNDPGGMKARQALLYAQWKRMAELGLSTTGDQDALDRYVTKAYLDFTGAVAHLTRGELDEQARKFGARIRGELAKRKAAAA